MMDPEYQERKRSIEVDMTSRFFKLEVENFDVTFTLNSEEFEQYWE